MYSRRQVIQLLQDIGVTEANLQGQMIDQKLPNSPFCGYAAKNMPQNRLSCYQSATIL